MGLAEYIAHWLEKFYAMVREAFAGVSASSAEAQLLTKAEADGMVHYSDELQKLWDDALVDAVENGRTNREIVMQSARDTDGDVDMKMARDINDPKLLHDAQSITDSEVKENLKLIKRLTAKNDKSYDKLYTPVKNITLSIFSSMRMLNWLPWLCQL